MYKRIALIVLALFGAGGCFLTRGNPMYQIERVDGDRRKEFLQTGMACPAVVSKIIERWAEAHKWFAQGTTDQQWVSRYVIIKPGMFIEAFYSYDDGTAMIHLGVVTPGSLDYELRRTAWNMFELDALFRDMRFAASTCVDSDVPYIGVPSH